MERVQYQQEQMLPELKDLEERGIFSRSEIKSILKQRTAFERELVRRIPSKSSFLRYVAFESNLEALRARRAARLPPAPPSLADHALPRRQLHILARALRKFKADVGLWTQYLALAKQLGAHALAKRIAAQALQLHPGHPALYVLVAQQELEDGGPTAARTLLQRGLRLNKQSVQLWTQYLKFELGFVEGLRRRWDVLQVGTDGDAAQREIMDGAIARTVISEAVKAIPRLPLFRALHTLLHTYPTPLRDPLLEHLHALLLHTLPTDPDARMLHACRFLPPEADTAEQTSPDAASASPPDTDDQTSADAGHSTPPPAPLALDTPDFVNAIHTAAQDLTALVRAGTLPLPSYASFVARWRARDIGPYLRKYLKASLKSLESPRP